MKCLVSKDTIKDTIKNWYYEISMHSLQNNLIGMKWEDTTKFLPQCRE